MVLLMTLTRNLVYAVTFLIGGVLTIWASRWISEEETPEDPIASPDALIERRKQLLIGVRILGGVFLAIAVGNAIRAVVG